MFAPKIAKEDKNDFNVFHPLPFDKYPPVGYLRDDIPAEGYQCVSIDVAIINFAVRIETRYPDGSVIPKYFDKIDFTKYGNTSERSGDATVNPEIIKASRQYFHDLLPYLKDSRIVVIERQMNVNTKSSKMFQHVLTMFLEHVDTFTYPCVITDIKAHLKGDIFNKPKGLTQHGLKEWGIDKALEILELRNDQESIKSIKYHRGKTKTKADDLADTVLQLEALIIIWEGLTTLIPDTLYKTIDMGKKDDPTESTEEFVTLELK